MTKDVEKAAGKSSNKDVEDFLQRVANVPAPGGGARGRLLFAIDATASRQPTWDRACHLQAEMFTEAASVGGLELQVAYYRGFGEFKATPWTSNSKALLKPMQRVFCLGGQTQIRKVLRHAIKETKKQKVNALVFVGDCMEEDIDSLCHQAGQLGVLGVPAFLFQEGMDPVAAQAFRQVARLTNGAYCQFDANSASMLRDLLRAVAVYAAGGRKALADFSRRTGGQTLAIAHQIK
jgi:hypothetical protein